MLSARRHGNASKVPGIYCKVAWYFSVKDAFFPPHLSVGAPALHPVLARTDLRVYAALLGVGLAR